MTNINLIYASIYRKICELPARKPHETIRRIKKHVQLFYFHVNVNVSSIDYALSRLPCTAQKWKRPKIVPLILNLFLSSKKVKRQRKNENYSIFAKWFFTVEWRTLPQYSFTVRILVKFAFCLLTFFEDKNNCFWSLQISFFWSFFLE